ncbi:MAG: GNAT family N-acetyltransferase, partial [Panacagrimonas sp.]
EGRHVVLEPLADAHAEALFAAAEDPSMFRYLSECLSSLDDHRAFIGRGLSERDAGRTIPFAIRLRGDGALVGTTRFAAIDLAHRRAEIGWTWIARKVQRSAVNTECKRLLLGHAFDVMQLDRVEFKTDALNQVSRTAIARLGATQEGIFRRHMVMPDGRVRDTVWFSILRQEWPIVREALDRKLAAPISAAPA